ncbi:MAG: M3 family metallopeptidase [Propionibacteriaceae bacterium]|jgi:peptidyl-dipeptidase Dcp|nr:M3 family metallopeptidase [Propionibacteriaceae bacterium]
MSDITDRMTAILNGQDFHLPDFEAFDDETSLVALRAGMSAQSDALATMAADTTPPTQQLLADWESSRRLLARAATAFWTRKSSDTNPRRDEIDEVFSPELAAHQDSIYLDAALFERFTALDARATAGEVKLDDEDRWFLSEILRGFRRAGIELDAPAMERLKQINTELAALTAKYQSLLVAGRRESDVHITDEAALDGLSAAQLAACREAAQARGREGWVIELVNTTGQPILADLNVRATRQAVFEASVGRGQFGDTDVRLVILEIIRLRDEKAKLLGFEHYAAYVADDGMAKTTENVMNLLTRVASASIPNAEKERVELQTLLDTLEPGETVQAWDWQWLAEKVKASKLSFDEGALRPYLEFESVLEKGVFAAATALYGITFHRRDDLRGYVDDCRFYEVHDADDSPIALAVFDPYSRPTKEGGAWMTSLVDQSHLFGELPVVTNNCNHAKPQPGQPSLMTWDQVTTLFHEFGHDLHGLLSDVRYPSLSGTSTPRDFVEYPSQVNEIWAWEPSLLAEYARHWETGEPLPQPMVDKIAASAHIGEGYAAAEIYQAMLLDQAWHQIPVENLPKNPDEIDAFEQRALEGFGVFYPLIPPRYRTCYFSHIWGLSYSAAYYAYLWSEVMDADTAAWFRDNGGLLRENGERFKKMILSIGYSRDLSQAYRDFRGADPDPIHLLRRRGLD